MRILILTIAALLAVPAAAQEGPSLPVAAVDSEKKICKKIGETGSRVAKRKVCATQREWDEVRRKAGDYARSFQQSGGRVGLPEGN